MLFEQLGTHGVCALHESYAHIGARWCHKRTNLHINTGLQDAAYVILEHQHHFRGHPTC